MCGQAGTEVTMCSFCPRLEHAQSWGQSQNQRVAVIEVEEIESTYGGRNYKGRWLRSEAAEGKGGRETVAVASMPTLSLGSEMESQCLPPLLVF